MFETYRMLGRERELELEAEAARLRPLAGRPLLHVRARTSTAAKRTQRKERTVNITRLITRLRIFSAAIVTAVVSVVVVGQAAAEVWPDGRYGAKLSTQQSYVIAPDDVTRMLSERSTPAPFPDFVDRYVQSHGTEAVQTTTPAPSQSADGFDWGAAGIGASTIAALLLAAGSGLVLVRRTARKSSPIGSV